LIAEVTYVKEEEEEGNEYHEEQQQHVLVGAIEFFLVCRLQA
jgi:hypothetical protein